MIMRGFLSELEKSAGMYKSLVKLLNEGKITQQQSKELLAFLKGRHSPIEHRMILPDLPYGSSLRLLRQNKRPSAIIMKEGKVSALPHALIPNWIKEQRGGR